MVRHFAALCLPDIFEEAGVGLGLYSAWLYDRGQWHFQYTDGKLPLFKKGTLLSIPRDIKEIWPLVLLKCMVKITGSLMQFESMSLE